MRWKDHKGADGTVYSLAHLHPTDFDHELPASPKHPGATVRIHVAFGLHTFTRKISAADPPEDNYSDSRETRCFDHDRYALSQRLPEIVRGLPTQRRIFFSRSLTGLVNYATFDAGDGTVYGVYFDLMRYKSRGPCDVLLTVESAYRHDPGKRDTTDGRVSFNVIVGHALRGTRPKPPPRAR